MKLHTLLATMVALAVLIMAAYAAEEGQKVDLKDIKCPVSGGKAKDIDGSSVAFKIGEEEFGRVYFCCPNCPKAYGKSPTKFANKAKLQLVATKQVEQLKCPLTGKDNPKVAVEIAGVDLKVCCRGCKGKLTKAEGDKQLDLLFANAKCPFEKAFKAAEGES